MNDTKQGVKVSKNYWMKVVLLFFIGWILIYATRTIFNPIMGVVGDEFGLSNTQLGLANSVFFLTYAILQIPSGMIGDKIGRKIVIAVGFIALAAMTYFSGIA
ncbi:MAG: MFS transporter, partial [Lactiplantibacillus plantarum]|nr:MFS transporter [Lactiplantibacillus plantarum]